MSPLKEFLDSPATRQLAKYQQIANEQTKNALSTRVELDQERAEVSCLKVGQI